MGCIGQICVRVCMLIRVTNSWSPNYNFTTVMSVLEFVTFPITDIRIRFGIYTIRLYVVPSYPDLLHTARNSNRMNKCNKIKIHFLLTTWHYGKEHVCIPIFAELLGRNTAPCSILDFIPDVGPSSHVIISKRVS